MMTTSDFMSLSLSRPSFSDILRKAVRDLWVECLMSIEADEDERAGRDGRI